MNITTTDIHAFYQQIYQNVSYRLEIQDCEWKSVTELKNDIKELNANVATALEEFIKAYDVWFETHKEIDSAGNYGNLNQQQNQKLMSAIKDRDKTRETLIQSLP